MFGSLLGAERGGHFAVEPTSSYGSDQTYVDRTNVLEHDPQGAKALRTVVSVWLSIGLLVHLAWNDSNSSSGTWKEGAQTTRTVTQSRTTRYAVLVSDGDELQGRGDAFPRMELSDTVSNRGRLVSALLSVVLIAVAIRSLRRGKRLSGALTGVGAVALGYDAVGRPRNLREPLGTDGTSEVGGELRCAICGEPIAVGEPREPNANDEIVHTACKGRPSVL